MNTPSLQELLLTLTLVSSTAVALAGLGTRLLQRKSAALRHLLWLLALSAPLVALPLSLVHGRITLPVLPAAPKPPVIEQMAPLPLPEVIVNPTPIAIAPLPTFPAPTAPARPTPIVAPAPQTPAALLKKFLPVLWACGTVLILGRILVARRRVRRLMRVGSSPASAELMARMTRVQQQIGLRRLVRLLVTSLTKIPFCHGAFRPTVIFPDTWREWDAQRVDVCLTHELAHIRRRDLPAMVVGQLACMLCWFNPLVWFAARKLRDEAENAADDLVLATIRPEIYAANLVAIAENYRATDLSPSMALSMARPNRLRARIAAILDSTLRRQSPTRATICAVALLALSALAACMVVRLIAAPARAAEERPAAPSAATNLRPFPDWSKASPAGLQVCAQPVKYEWASDETPAFTLSLRNSGREPIDYLGVAEVECQIEVDGRQYGWSKGMTLRNPVQRLAPNEEKLRLLTVKLTGEWTRPVDGNMPPWFPERATSESEPLKLNPGKHMVRITFRPSRDIEAVTNPLEIEIAAPAPPAAEWGQASAEGLQVSVKPVARDWKSGETPALALRLRNSGKQTWMVRSSYHECAVEVDGKWYGWSLPLDTAIDEIVGALRASQEMNWTREIGLSGEWALPAKEGGAHLKLSPGRHTIRVSVNLKEGFEAGSKSTGATSNPVEIEIAAPAGAADQIPLIQSPTTTPATPAPPLPGAEELPQMVGKSAEQLFKEHFATLKKLTGLSGAYPDGAFWNVWKFKTPIPKSPDEKTSYVVFAGRPLVTSPGTSAASVVLLAENGEQLGKWSFSTGYRINIKSAAFAYDEKLGTYLLTIQTTPDLGPDMGREYYALRGQHLYYLRGENSKGALVHNEYRYPEHTIGGAWPAQTKKEWLALLTSEQPAEWLAALNCLGGQHTDPDKPLEYASQESQALGKFIQDLRADPAVRASIEKARHATQPWLREAAELASPTPPPAEWGQASAEGLQVHVQAEKRAWKSKETPAFILSLRNSGREPLTYLGLPEVECQIEVDGRQYGWSKNVTLRNPLHQLAPSEEKLRLLTVQLTGEWARPIDGSMPLWFPVNATSGGEPPKLNPGKHIIRIFLRPEGVSFRPPRLIEAVSNPVEIEIAAAAPPPETEKTGASVEARPVMNFTATSEQVARIEALVKTAPVAKLDAIHTALPGVPAIPVQQVAAPGKRLSSFVPFGDIYISDTGSFYLRWDSVLSSGIHCYGPFSGTPESVLGLKRNAFSFGPVTELLVTEGADLDTGKFVSAQEPNTDNNLGPSGIVERHGGDVYRSGQTLRFVSTAQAFVPDPGAWDKYSPLLVLNDLSAMTSLTELDVQKTGSTGLETILRPEWAAGDTCLFQTRTGRHGILQVVSAAADGVKIRYKLVQTAAAPPQAAVWGAANAAGVQVNLEATKSRWRSDEAPEFAVRMRNTGRAQVSYIGLPETDCVVEVDGQWYGQTEMIDLDHLQQFMAPGQERAMPRALVLNGIWARPADGGKPKPSATPRQGKWGETLKLKPGRHTVRVAWTADDPAGEAISNPVEIVVEERNWGAANAQGVQVNLEAKKRLWRSDEPPAFTMQVRNTGQERLAHNGMPETECAVEVDGQWHHSKVEPPDGPPHFLAPGEEKDLLILMLGRDWGFEPTPGRHTVRMAWKEAISNPVEIEIEVAAPVAAIFEKLNEELKVAHEHLAEVLRDAPESDPKVVAAKENIRALEKRMEQTKKSGDFSDIEAAWQKLRPEPLPAPQADADRAALETKLREALEMVARQQAAFNAGTIRNSDLEDAKDKVEILKAEMLGNPTVVAQARLAAAERRVARQQAAFDAGIINNYDLQAAKDEVEMRKAELVGDPVVIAETRLAVARRQLELAGQAFRANFISVSQLDAKKADVVDAEAALQKVSPSAKGRAGEEAEQLVAGWQIPVQVTKIDLWTDGGTVEFVLLNETTGKELAVCLDSREEESTGDLFVGALHPSQKAARRLTAGGPGEGKIIGLLKDWLARNVPEARAKELLARNSVVGLSETEVRQLRILGVVDHLERRRTERQDAAPAKTPEAFGPTNAPASPAPPEAPFKVNRSVTGRTFDGFACVRSDRVGEGLVGRSMIVGRIQGAEAKMQDVAIPADAERWDLLGVAGSQAYLGRLYLPLTEQVKTLDLGTGALRAFPAGAGGAQALGLAWGPTMRGDAALSWDGSTRGQKSFSFALMLSGPGNPWRKVWDGAQYETWRAFVNNIAVPQPPVVWLNDTHALTVRTAEDHYEVVVVDLLKGQARDLGALPLQGRAELVAPRGEGGDALVVVNGGTAGLDGVSRAKMYAVNVPDTLAGQGKVEERPAQWGRFTIEKVDCLYGPTALSVGALSCAGQPLAKNVVVSVSPDGQHALWQFRPAPPKFDGWDLFLFTPGAGEARKVARGDALGMPVWFSLDPDATAPSR